MLSANRFGTTCWVFWSGKQTHSSCTSSLDEAVCKIRCCECLSLLLIRLYIITMLLPDGIGLFSWVCISILQSVDITDGRLILESALKNALQFNLSLNNNHTLNITVHSISFTSKCYGAVFHELVPVLSCALWCICIWAHLWLTQYTVINLLIYR